MDTKLLVTLNRPEDAAAVRAAGCEVLAEYPDSMLVRATDAQRDQLMRADIEIVPLPQPTVHVAGTEFDMTRAVEADAAAPVPTDPNRTAYYVVEAVGPIQGAWLDAVGALGGTVHATLPDFALLVGMLPARMGQLQSQGWVESISAYRPAMKISPKLRQSGTRSLGTEELTTPDLGELDPDARQQIEIDVFAGESAEAVAAQVRDSGGLVLDQTARTIKAVVPPQTIVELAERQGVQAILPDAFPEFHNDQATAIMGAPPDRTFGDLTLRGTGQIVAVADSGLDTGNTATVHADVNGRVVNIVSWPTNTAFAPYTNDPAGNDDGSADTNSSHGTHVTGSVLGNGAAAIAAGGTPVPTGMAPESQVYFQAIEQRVNWKTAAQLSAAGLAPFTAPWPPPAASLWGLPTNLTTLFDAAYMAGARIHTNSWGAPVAGVYNANARAVDQYMWTHRDMLIVFSAGNSGVDTDSNGVVDNDSIGSPGTAKNCVTVGASENNRPNGSTPAPGLNINWSAWNWPALGAAGHVSDNPNGMAAFSSRGPTDDGRIKPDVVAPGTNVLSLRSSTYAPATPPLWGDLPAANPLNGLYCWSGGTSMSTPLVAGAVALIRQHLVQQRGHSQPGVKPSGALIKAFLVNGAAPLAGQFAGEVPGGQNNVSGFGRVNIADSITPGALQQTLFADEPDLAVETGQMRTFEAQAIDLSQPLKITLAWTDAPSPAGVGGLQNRLYLQVRDPGGAITNGDVTAFPTVSNNVQQVVIAAPVAGTYEIRVRGVSVTTQAPGASGGPNPRQDFAIAVSNAIGPSVQPVSIAQAIDTTGSMAFFGYMEPAKERATQLVDFLRVNDKVSITEFSQRPALPHARTPYPLRLMNAFNPDWTDAHTAIGGLIANGMTPIGAGLQAAWMQLQPEPVSRPRAIVLLSDGLNNVAPDPMSVLPAIPNDVPIFAVALGPAGSTPTLQSIANSRPNGGYYVVGSDEEIHKLHEIYALVQALASGAAIIGLSSVDVAESAESSHEMPVEDGVAEAAWSLSWAGANRKVELIVTGPDGMQYDSSTAATVERRGATHHFVRVGVPRPGMWRLTVRHRDGRPLRYTVSGAVSSPLALAANSSVVGDHLRITARLRRGQKPWDDAKVFARLTLPTRSRREVLERWGERIKAIKLPEELDEPGLTNDQRLAMQLAVFAQKFGMKDGGLYGRTAIEIALDPQGDGVWTGDVPIAADGDATVEVIARGEIDGYAWERLATSGLHLPERKRLRGLRIEDIKIGRRGKIATISARVLDQTNIAYPREGTRVGVRVANGDGRPRDLAMRYSYHTKRYQVASPLPLGKLHLEVHADQKDDHTEEAVDISL